MLKEPTIPWRDCPFQTVQNAALVLGLSSASIYALQKQGRLRFRKLAGRTLVETSSVLEVLETAEAWAPSDRADKAKEARAAYAKESWT